MQEYFETVHNEPGQDFPTTTAHDDLESAIEFAEAHNIPTIYGEYDTYEKCWFCEQWIPICEIQSDGACDMCHLEFRSRGEE